MTLKEEDAALATSPCACFSSVPAFKTSSLTHRPALSRAGEPLSPAVAEVFRGCHLHLTAALQSTPGSALQRASYCEQTPARGSPWSGGFDIQLKSGTGGGDLKIREHGITISEQSTINSCSVLGRLARHIHAMDTPGFGCLPMPINVQLSQNTACTY